MGVVTYSQEFKSAIAPSRMFKALVLDSHNVIPEIVLGGIRSVEFTEGNDVHIKYMKHKIDALDVENFYYKYTLIESDIKFDKIDFIVYEVKFVSLADGACVCKMSSEYHAKEGAKLKEDDIKQGKDRAMGLFKSIEKYLLANPVFFSPLCA
ncbi:hypothetical protein BT93_C0723 [Corymbia citriodora subsp. variegata]|nr:hypothetical protein BT93_C0723 [Corymbia citriodora subsp. variegata]